MRYIDFDGVILDTEEILFEEWRKNPDSHLLSEKEKIEYIKNANWKYVLENSKIINDAIYILRQSDPNKVAILTRVHSLENEGAEKIKYLRRKLVENQIILAPYNLRKDEVVEAYGNILVDDSLRNLKQWCKAGGYPMYFNKNNGNIDPWGSCNDNYHYQKVLKIDEEIKRK